MRIPILQRYVFKAFVPFFALSLIIFASLLMMVNFVQFVNRGILTGFSFYFLFKAAAYMLPGVLSLILPLSFLMAVLLTLGELSSDGEIMAMRAGGYSFNEILKPLFLSALAISFILIFTNNWFAPLSLRESNKYVLAMAGKITKVELKPKIFQKMADWEIYSDFVDGKKNLLKRVKVSRTFRNNKGEPSWVMKINSSKANYKVLKEQGIVINFINGRFNQINFKNKEKLIYGDFDVYSTFMPFFSEKTLRRKLYRFEMSSHEILKKLKARVLNESMTLKYKIEFLTRQTLIFAPLIFFIIGAPLGLLLEKKGKGMGFSLTLLIIFLYYGFSILCQVAVKKYPAAFPWIMFFPPVAGFGAGFYIWKEKLYLK